MCASRTTTRPRPSLNCKTCRRRKVRCTKERPACHSCVRTKDICEYDNDQYQNAKISDKTIGNQGTKSGDDDWVNWTVQEFADKPAGSANTTALEDQSCRPDHSSDRQVVPLSPAYSTPNDEVYTTLDPSGEIGSSADNIWHTHLAEMDHTFSTEMAWMNTPPSLANSKSSEVLQTQTRQSNSKSSSSPYQQSDQLRKRPRQSIEPVPEKVQTIKHSPMKSGQDDGARESAKASCHAYRDVPAPGQQDTRIPGFLSTRNGAFIRHVNPMFWAYVKGNVSGSFHL